jgi:high-affinity iron transporter
LISNPSPEVEREPETPEATARLPARLERLSPGTRSSFASPGWRVAMCLGFGIALIACFLLLVIFKSNSRPLLLAESRKQLSAILDIGILVFREGLECVLVLAALTAGMRGADRNLRRPVSAGVGIAMLAVLLTWNIAVRILDDLGENLSALALQAGTGLLAIIVLLVVMNWFFHKLYWTGWISLHTESSRRLLKSQNASGSRPRVTAGMVLLGFTSFYREGFEVVLFLQGYRLRLPGTVILFGVLSGAIASAIVAVLTFVIHRRLPYRRMLVCTGLLLAVVLLVMVGEEAQEMQLAHWLPTTAIPWLARAIPSWMGMWLSVFPTVETLGSQILAGVLVFGSYFTAQPSKHA